MKNFILALFTCWIFFLPAKTFVVTHTNETGPGSLSQAVNDANLWRGLDTILFDLPGSGPFFLGSTPDNFEITDPVFIDGFSQPGNLVVNINLYTPKSFTIRVSDVTIRGFRFNTIQATTWIFIEPLTTTPLTDILITLNRFDMLTNSKGVEVSLGGRGEKHLDRLTISQNYFKGYGAVEAVYVYESAIFDTPTISQVTISQNTFKDCEGIFWGLQGENEDILISQNIFDESKGIDLYVNKGKTDGMLITRNTMISGPGSISLSVAHNAELKDVEISHNQMEQCSTGHCNGIRVSVSGDRNKMCRLSALRIIDNTIKDRNYGIQLIQGGTSDIEGFIDTMVIADNHISGCRSHGISLKLGATGNAKLTLDSLLISRNVISYNGYSGIDIGASPLSFSSFEIKKIVISRNEILHNKDGVDIHMSGRCSHLDSHINFGNSIVIDNIIHDNLEHGIIYENRGGISPQAPNYHGIIFLQNSIYNNGALGIWSRDYYFQNGTVSMFPAPFIQTIAENGGGYNASGNLTAAQPNTSYLIEFYANTLPDSSGNGEGERYLGQYSLVTDMNGDGLFNFMTSEDIGYEYISATSTQVNKGNTSEFGNALSLHSPGLGIEEMEDFPIELFPNPAHDFLYLKWEPIKQFRELRICALDGSTLFTQNIKRQNHLVKIPVQGLPNGIYSVTVQGEEGQIFSRNWVKAVE